MKKNTPLKKFPLSSSYYKGFFPSSTRIKMIWGNYVFSIFLIFLKRWVYRWLVFSSFFSSSKPFLWCPKDSADKKNGRFIIGKKFPLSGIFYNFQLKNLQIFLNFLKRWVYIRLVFASYFSSPKHFLWSSKDSTDKSNGGFIIQAKSPLTCFI